MPAAYAHHRFGETCLNLMPDKLRMICEENRSLYDFGVHGPDLLFYCNPLKVNEVNSHGSEMHFWSGTQFFEICYYVYHGMNGQLDLSAKERRAMLAYIIGYLAHFTLDSSCHHLINSLEDEDNKITHNRIESYYEVYLMRKDGKDPAKVNRSAPLHPSRTRAAIVAHLYPFGADKILESMRGQKAVLGLFYSPYNIKKNIVRMLIKAIKLKGNFGDLFLDYDSPELYEQFNEKIYAMQKKAEERFPALLKNLMLHFQGKEELGEYFLYNFEGETGYHDYKKEIN